MKNKLKKKMNAKKISRNNIWRPKSARRKVYEMPDDYKNNLQKLTEMLDDRGEYDRLLPTLPPEVRAGAMPILRKLDKNLEKLEQSLADEYEIFQNEQREIEENEEKRQLAWSRLYEFIQRIYIVAKHKFEPADFKEFEADLIRKWSPQFKKTFYEHIIIRESYDLENILADPEGGIKRPMKHPQIQMKEAVFEIARIAYVTDDFFKETEAEYENILAIRDKAEKDLWLHNPEERRKQRKRIEKLDRQIDGFKPQLMDYLNICFAEDGKIEVENPDRKKLDAAFAEAAIAHERVYLMYKHTRPEQLKKFTEVCLSAYDTPEDIEDFYKRIAEREAKELDEILASVGQKRKK